MKPFYYPGEFIQGTIFFRVLRPIEAKSVDIQVKGKEKGSFLDIHYETVTENGNSRQERREIKRKMGKTIIDFTAPCFNFATSILNPGDYSIPFAFQVPGGLPSSLNYKNSHVERKPKAKVKYHIRASLSDHHGHAHMKYKQVLIVREVQP